MANAALPEGATRWDQAPTVNTAEAELSKLIQKETTIQAKLEELKSEVAKLEYERTDVGKRCGKLILLVAEKLCRKFADKFHATLPPELRDMVYAHVWDGPMLDLVFDNVTIYNKNPAHSRYPTASTSAMSDEDLIKHKPWSVACTSKPCRCFRWWERPIWAQHQFVGMDIAKEVVAAYYRAQRPCIPLASLSELDNRLSIDHFHLGVKPADHIRRLDLDLNYFNLRESPTKLFETLHSLGEDDCALYNIHKMCTFQLTFRIAWLDIVVYEDRALMVTRAIAEKLREAGAKVAALAWCHVLRQEYDVSDYYTLSPAQWEAKWTKKVRKDTRRLRSELLRRNAGKGSTSLGNMPSSMSRNLASLYSFLDELDPSTPGLPPPSTQYGVTFPPYYTPVLQYHLQPGHGLAGAMAQAHHAYDYSDGDEEEDEDNNNTNAPVSSGLGSAPLQTTEYMSPPTSSHNFIIENLEASDF